MSTPPNAAALVAALETHQITHAVGLPDNMSAALLAELAAHERIRFVRVTREGEAFAIASGLWLGGAKPIVVVQNTGLLESGDALRGTAARMGVPLVTFVTYRGYARMLASGLDRAARPLARSVLVDADVDSVAFVTEATLTAWGVPFIEYDGDRGPTTIARAFARARQEERPVAVLLTHALS